MKTLSDLPIKTVESKVSGVTAIQLTEEPFSGIIYSYGKVDFEEDVENFKLKIKFDYEIHDMGDKVLTDAAPFEQYIGDILQDLIHIGIQENSITYTGGVDEN